MKKIAEEYNISKVRISTLWKGIKTDIAAGKLINSDRKFTGGQPKLNIDLEKVRSIPVRERGSIRKLAIKMNLHPSTVGRLIRKGALRSHTNAIKPLLTNANKVARIKWCLGKIVGNSLNNGQVFKDMYNVVHLDEKWFFMTNTTEKYYLLPDEMEPHRTCKSKRFITKVMFMAAVARPIFSNQGSVLFDGKIGIFPFTYEEPAKRASRNRARGTMETKPIQRITKEVTKEYLISKIIPAIKSKWPEGASRRIYIQQDNAKPHIRGDDPDFLNAAQSDGFDIRLVSQPPNSPDLNVLDLGFFRSIQSLQYEISATTVSELVDAVTTAFEQVEPQKLKYVWLSLHYCMNEILRVLGNNNYRLPHNGKQRLERLGLLPDQVTVNEEYLAKALQHITQQQQGD
ncbi:hypothetical protein RND81_07G081800 [Saponaria officinalis]|uniref:Transposase n=1 Tax=Saponaria officinalis TaxID=3572 RepID=A0AAW1JL75_SAPOF